MAGQPGQQLSEEEVREYAAYHNNQITLPPKFDGVVIENTTAGGPVYRWQTNAEAKAAKDAASDAIKATESDAAMNERVRAEAAKRGVEVPPIPEQPAAPAAPMQSTDRR